ncbi:MAG: metallophosphoesterase family protein [Clostridia bacterium]|nr:metallophosphoesterase family protein [Clostridia bacterium]
MYSEKLTFNKNGKFRIMQIADVQECATVNPDTIKLMTLALEKEKPDLVVFTGDQIYGIHPSFYNKNRKELARKVLKEIIAPIEKAGIPFAVTYGNHDCQVGLSNAQQADIYAESPFNISGEPHSDEDRGTFRLPIYDEESHIFDIYLFDSNGQAPTGEYLPVSEEQINWFRAEREKAREDGKYTNSIAFQHIPVPEFYDVIKRVKFGTKGAVEAFRKHKGEWYVLPEEVLKAGGFMGESPATPDRNSGQLEALREKGNVLGLLVGHDHINSFIAEKDGIKLIYTQGAGFNVYGPGRNRGVRIVELDKNALGSFDTYTVTFGSLTDDKLGNPLQEFIFAHIPTSIEPVKRIAAVGLGVAAVLGTAELIAYKKLRK